MMSGAEEGLRDAGGRVLCHGPTCSVRFENCRFSKCGVVAIGGAVVTFINCLIKHVDIGVFANGPGTNLIIRKLEAVDCRQVTPPLSFCCPHRNPCHDNTLQLCVFNLDHGNIP